VFRIIDELKEIQVGCVYILGGEPLMRDDFPAILEKFAEHDIPLTLGTNGWFINEEWAERLAKSTIKFLRFSLDGACPETHDSFRGMQGSYKRIVNGIRVCRDAGIQNIGCSFTITKENYNEIKQTCELLAKLEVNEIQLGPISPTGRAVEYPELFLDPMDIIEISNTIHECINEHGDRLSIYSVDGTYDRPDTRMVKKGLKEPDFMGCQAGRTCLNIDWKGDVIPCLLWRDRIAGSLRKQTLRDIWDNSPLFNELRRPRGEEHSECTTCYYSNVCARECPLSSSQTDYTAQQRTKRIQELQKLTEDLRPCMITSQSECSLLSCTQNPPGVPTIR
jgi:radical SAM protein with 4Fe4S-binding SPASM domain